MKRKVSKVNQHSSKKIMTLVLLIGALFTSSALVIVECKAESSSFRYHGPKLCGDSMGGQVIGDEEREVLIKEYERLECISDFRQILDRNRTYMKTMIFSPLLFSGLNARRTETCVQWEVKFLPHADAFDSEKLWKKFTSGVRKSWEDWWRCASAPTSFELLDQEGNLSAYDPKIRVGIRILMKEKTEDGSRLLQINARTDEESTGVLSVEWSPSSLASPEMKNVPYDWIHDINKESRRGPLSFKIADYRTFKMMPMINADDRKSTFPVQERTAHVIEKIFVPFPQNAGKVKFDIFFQALLRSLGPLSETDHLYFCYERNDPTINGRVVVKDIQKVAPTLFMGRKRSSSSIFSFPDKIYESKFSFTDEPTIFIEVPAMAKVRLNFERCEQSRVMTMKDLVNNMWTDELQPAPKWETISTSRKLIAKESFFNNQDNALLWQYLAEQDGIREATKVESYENFPKKGFFDLKVLEDTDDPKNLYLTKVPRLRLSLSDTTIAMIRNLYNLKLQYELLRDYTLNRFKNHQQNSNAIKAIMNDIAAGKLDWEEVMTLIKAIYFDGLITKYKTDIEYTPKTDLALWYKNAKDVFGLTLPQVKVDNWHRIVQMFADYATDDFYIDGALDGKSFTGKVFSNKYESIDLPVLDAEQMGPDFENKAHVLTLKNIYSNAIDVKTVDCKDAFNADKFIKSAPKIGSEIGTNNADQLIYSFRLVKNPSQIPSGMQPPPKRT